jgi:CheY-like chemotaxis protein
MPKHIVCADDSVTMQRVVAITFVHTDFTVASARSADEALEQARQRRPDLVLADAVMPGKTGYDLCAAIKSDPALRGVPVVIVCGNSQAYDEARGKTAGADAHLTKPWDTQVFLDKVNEILTRVGRDGVAPGAGGAAPAPPAPVAAPPVAAPPPAAAPPARPMTAAPAPSAPPAPAAARPPIYPASPSPIATARPTIPPVAAPARPATLPAGPAPTPGAPLAARPAPGVLPKPPPGLPRPPLIRGVQPGGVRPQTAVPGTIPPAPTAPVPSAVPPGGRQQPRSATIMGMPAVSMPPAMGSAPAVPLRQPQAPLAQPTPPPPAPALPVAPAAPSLPVAPSSAKTDPSVSKPANPPPPAAPALSTVPATTAQAVNQVAQRIAPAITERAQAALGADAKPAEIEAIAKLSREIIERICWEVIPDLAEVIIRENLDKFRK